MGYVKLGLPRKIPECGSRSPDNKTHTGEGFIEEK